MPSPIQALSGVRDSALGYLTATGAGPGESRCSGSAAIRLLRKARMADAGAIAGLLGDLGYPSPVSDVKEILGRLLGREDCGVLVAEKDAEAIGLATFQIIDLLERGRPQCRLTALVVRPDHRREGVAAKLIEAIEAIARRNGCFRLEVTTSSERVGAHAFYARHGFIERPRRLVKRLEAS